MLTQSGMDQGPGRPLVVVVDDDEDLRYLFGKLIESRCGSWLGASSFDDLTGLGEAALRARLVILDVNLGATSPSGVTAYRWLKDHRFGGRVVFLTGHAMSYPELVALQKAERI